MEGQWRGRYSGSATGNIMINIDVVGKEYAAVAYLNPDDNRLPFTVAHFTVPEGYNGEAITAHLGVINPKTLEQHPWEELREQFDDDVDHPDNAELKVEYHTEFLKLHATTPEGATFSCELPNSRLPDKSILDGAKISWEEFKEKALGFEEEEAFLFRGQAKNWPLATSFHRRGRYRLGEFLNKDRIQLYRRLSAVTSHFFNLEIPDQNGAFFNLLQHHGYPTPLLDWSYSPFVAAFFAFSVLDKHKTYSEDECVRIFIFDRKSWSEKFTPLNYLDPAIPHISVMDFVALDNPRKIPQQAITTATNIVNIEDFIREQETLHNKRFLAALDIPATERRKAMRELAYMGITAGSIYPGIEGVCQEMLEKNF